jgi:hypothetical protein
VKLQPEERKHDQLRHGREQHHADGNRHQRDREFGQDDLRVRQRHRLPEQDAAIPSLGEQAIDQVEEHHDAGERGNQLRNAQERNRDRGLRDVVVLGLRNCLANFLAVGVAQALDGLDVGSLENALGRMPWDDDEEQPGRQDDDDSCPHQWRNPQ